MTAVFNYILNDMGATVFMPIMLIIIALCLRIRIVDSISDGLMLGMGIYLIRAVAQLMERVMEPVVTGFSEQTGANLTVLDVGWPVCESMSFANPYIFVIFAVAIGVNLLMLVTKLTNELNIDVFNMWYLSETYVLMYAACHSVAISFIIVIVEVAIGLIVSERMEQHCREISGVKNVTASCPAMNSIIFVYVFEFILSRIPFLDRDFSVEGLQAKYGDFFSTHVIGFFVATILSLIARYPIAESLQNGIVMGGVLYALPMLADLFTIAFRRVSDRLATTLKENFGGRDFCIGIDWPFLGGRAEMWLCNVLITPVTVAMAVFMPGVKVLFLVTMGSYVTHAALVATEANLLHMLIIGICMQPIAIYSSGYAAPFVTEAAAQYGAYELAPGQQITSSLAFPEFRCVCWELLEGHMLGFIFLAGFVAVLAFYLYFMSKDEKAIKERLDAKEAEEAAAAAATAG